ncbi:MAG: flagellar hook-associated protein 1 [Pseudomonadota bacterium]
MTTAISVAMRSALSGLQVNQTSLGITSNNIANANTEGYTRKIADLQTVLIAGQGGGVEVSGIGREVSDFLIRDLRTQYSLLAENQVLDRYYSNTQDIFGPPGSSSSIAATVTELANRFQALSIDPESPAAQQDVVSAGLAVTRQLNKMSATVQDLRMEANKEIDKLVTEANTIVSNINELNSQISRNKALGRPTGDLEDQRDREVANLASIMNISFFNRDNGQMVVFAANGRTLVDTIPATVEYTPTSSMSSTLTYPTSIDGITVNGNDITTSITSGKLKALIDLRDTILPGFGDQIDELASVLRDQIDAIHNDGAAVPPPNTLTGVRQFSAPATDTVNLSGVVRIAVVDQTGNAVGTPIDLDFADLATVVGGTPTVNQIVNAINGSYAASTPAIPGLSGATASVNASGQLVITASSSSNGIAINEGTSAESTTGFGFSHYFGLNNFFTGITTGGLASNITVRSDLVSDPQLLVRGQLSEATLASGDAAVTIGDNSVVQRMFNKFQETLTFSAAGTVPQSSSSLAGYGATIVATNANQASRAHTDLSFREVIFNDIKARSDSQSGVNLDEEMGNLILFQNAYAANARMISALSEVMKILSELV